MRKGEFELIDSIRSMFTVPSGVMGIGDDCAVIPQQSGLETVVSTDMLMEGAHFLMEDVEPYQLGWKSAAVNISDIAAMGGSPSGSFLAFSLPASLPDGWVGEFMRGYADISREYGFPLLGGDTTGSPDRLCICVTVMGQCPLGRSVKRSGAKAGDLICVTGNLGDSGAGLEVILKGLDRENEDNRYLVDRHYLPRPRLAEGISLMQAGVSSMMDISDGIGSDLRHIMEESHVGAVVETEALPISAQLARFCESRGLDPLKFAVGGGEDYELLFTADPQTESSLTVPHTVIGRIVEGSQLELRGCNGNYSGFTHF